MPENPDWTNPEKPPFENAGLVWSEAFKRWVFPDNRTPDEKAKDEEIARQHEEFRKFWEPVSSRIIEKFWKGVSCGRGWAPAIMKLVERLDWVWEGFDPKFKAEECWGLMQVKEKLGGLRFYAQIMIKPEEGDPEPQKKDYAMRSGIMHDLITHAEWECANMCEDCGKPGERRSVGGWLGTVCQEHYEEWLSRRFEEDRRIHKDEDLKIEDLMDDTEREKRGLSPRQEELS